MSSSPRASRRAKIIPIHAPKDLPVHPFDRRYKTDTGGLTPRSELLTGHANDQHLTAYYGVAPSILEALISLWLRSGPPLPIDRYTFLDIGAGKGRAMMIASQHPFLETVGVELNPGLAEVARQNLARFQKSGEPLSPARVVEGDILETPLPEGPTLGYMFHPFEAPVLRRLLRRIEQHCGGKEESEPFDLLYVNAEHGSVLDRSARFTRLFHGSVPMSAEDHLADLAEIEGQQEYGSTGDELCSVYRMLRVGV
jgi:SAM-dependent methyltransferase